jgi:hypothetical protein
LSSLLFSPKPYAHHIRWQQLFRVWTVKVYRFIPLRIPSNEKAGCASCFAALDNFGAWFGLYVGDLKLYHSAIIAATISSQISTSAAADKLALIIAAVLLLV